MVTITRIAFAFSVIFSIVMVVSFALPKKYKLQESLFVEKKATEVYHIVNDLTTWKDWTVWNTTKLPNTTIQYTEQTTGINARKTIYGSGSNIVILITKSEPNQFVQYELVIQDKGGNPQLEVDGVIQITDNGVKPTTVTWTIGGDWGNNPIFRYVGLVLKQKMQQELQDNLEGLQQINK